MILTYKNIYARGTVPSVRDCLMIGPAQMFTTVIDGGANICMDREGEAETSSYHGFNPGLWLNEVTYENKK